MQFRRDEHGREMIPPMLRNGFTVKWYAVHALKRSGMLERSQRRHYLTGQPRRAQAGA